MTTLKVMSSSDGQRMIEIPESSRWNLLSKPSEQFKTVALPSLTDVWSAAFLLCRCLLCRLDEVSLSYFWPVMLPELMHVVRLPCGEGIGGEEVQEAVRIVKLEAIKTIDMALTVCPASFSVFRWVFLENRIWVPADVSAYSLFAQSWSSKTSPSLPRTGSRFMLGEEAVGSCGLLRRPKQNRQNESSLLDEKENLRMRASSSMLYFELKEEERYRRFVESRAASQLRSSLLRRPWLYVLPSQRKWMESWEGIRFATHLLLRCHPYPALCSGPLEGEEIGPDCRGAALRDTLTGLIDDCIARSAPSGWSWDVEDVRNVLLLDISHKRK